MAFSNIIAVAIMITTAATLNANGITDIETSSQAAETLRPIAGSAAYVIFTLGIIGTGLLAVPVLAGSAAYGVGETLRSPVGLTREPKDALVFYGTLGFATLIGVGLNLTPLNPIKALYWSAVINGIVAVPVMALMMFMVARSSVMGEFVIRGWLAALGWAATITMMLSVAGMAVTWLT
jgi:Mn2+/Fe2+ NRAMP family transporter